MPRGYEKRGGAQCAAPAVNAGSIRRWLWVRSGPVPTTVAAAQQSQAYADQGE